MKNLLLLTLILFSCSLIAQTANKVNNEGDVIYVTTMNLHKQVRGDRAEEIKKRIPEFQKMKSILYFSPTEMLYHKLEEDADVKEEDLQEGRGGGRGRGFRMRMMGGSADDRFYTNIDDEIVAEKTDFLGKTFLVEGDMKLRQWKLTGEQKTILGYVCQKAELVIKVDPAPKKEEDDGRGRRRGPRPPKSVSAWFTTQIPVAGGPRDYHQLPGMVLEVNIDNGNQIILAESVNLKKLDKKVITKPTEGKKVTREELKKIQKEKMEELRKERGGKGHHGGGGKRIIIQN